MQQRTFTKLSIELKERLDNEFANLHSKEEVDFLIREFIDVPPSGKGDAEREIVKILVACDDITGYTNEYGSTPILKDRTDPNEVKRVAKIYSQLAEKLPDDKKLNLMFYEKIRSVYKDYKTSVEYMERLVKNRMSVLNKEVMRENDTTRVLILKQFLKVVNFPKKSSVYSNEMRKYLLGFMGLSEEATSEEAEEAIATLDDSVFQIIAEKHSIDKELKKEYTDLKKKKSVAEKAVKEAKIIYEEAKLNEDATTEKTNLEKAQQLFCEIELKYASVAKEYNRQDEKQKNHKDDYEALLFADDLSKGFFNNQKTTRKELYWFAIIFEMTFYYGAVDEIRDPETDILKKLFYDYYANSLLNSVISDMPNSEKEPTGYGINLKNYAEIIYLYYLRKKNLTPEQKLVKVKKMIKKCKAKTLAQEKEQIKRHSEKSTIVYRSLFEKIMGSSEDDLLDYIQNNYVCGQVAVKSSLENRTAASIYREMFYEVLKLSEMLYDHTRIGTDVYLSMEKEYYETRCSDCKKKTGELIYKDCPLFQVECADKYSEYRANKLTPEKDKKNTKEHKARIIKNKSILVLREIKESFNVPKEQIANFDDEIFERVIKKIYSSFVLVEENKTTLRDCLEASFIPTDDLGNYITRTKMIILYYYLFLLQNDNIYSGFNEFYEDFCSGMELYVSDDIYNGINDCLVASGYQEINTKNIFDILIIFFAFRKHKIIQKLKQEINI